jgi:3-dehydroquinate synthetase
VPVVQAPTTLLAMVDAAIGGKTAVDTPAGKNLVGAFHPPAAVVIDPTVLRTLSPRDVRGGLAEMLKHGAILDARHFADAAALGARLHEAFERGGGIDWGAADLVALIADSAAIKAAVVADDPRESGRRQVLNAGHTVAHALELVLNYQLPHGEAVAIGLAAEAILGERAGVTEAGTARALRSALGGAGLPVAPPAGVDPREVAAAMRTDKKGRRGRPSFALLASIGRVAGDAGHGWTTVLDEALVVDALAAAFGRPASHPIAAGGE